MYHLLRPIIACIVSDINLQEFLLKRCMLFIPFSVSAVQLSVYKCHVIAKQLLGV